ncbi:MAG: hypothetical protein HYV39_01260 [Candidatus Levybacteria bacterium]|nr:hypothetical protein [Candidatus Levybacteria bacterium]
MEYINPLKRFWYFIAYSSYKRTLGLLLFLLIAAGVPLATWIVQQQTQIKQQAAQNGTVQFTSDQGGNNVIQQTANPELYLKITLPDNWTLSPQSRANPASPLASFVEKAYAAACVAPSVCSSDPNPDPNIWTRTDGECADNEEGETMYCYVRKSGGGGGGGGSTPTPTPTTQPPSQTRCTEVRVANSSPPKQGESIFVGVKYTGNPTSIKFWISNNDQLNKTSAVEVGDNWTFVDTKSPIPESEYNLSSTAQFDPGRHFVLAELLNNQGTVVDNDRARCGSPAFTLEAGSPSTPTTAPTAPPTGPQITLYQIHIQNSDGGSGGLDPQRITGASDLARFFANPYWKLNPNAAGTTRKVQVDFYGRNAQGNEVQKQITTPITYTGSADTPPAPTRTPFGCERTPEQMGTNVSDTLPLSEQNKVYRWVQVTKSGEPTEKCETEYFDAAVCIEPPGSKTDAEKNSQCPQNTLPDPFNKIAEETSNWCTRKSDDPHTDVAHCWQLRYIGSAGGGGAPPPAVPTVTPRPGEPTVTPRPTVTPGGPTVTPTNTPTPSPTGSPAPTPTITPSVTPGGPSLTPTTTPTVGPTATSTPIPPGTTTMSLSVSLSGIGPQGRTGTPQAKNNPKPTDEKRDLAIYFYEAGVDPTDDINGSKAKWFTTVQDKLEYDGSGKFVAKDIVVDERVTTGDYQILIKSPRYLRKRVPGIKHIIQGKGNQISPLVTLILGDANNDNKLDTMDYNIYFGCLGKQTDDCRRQVDFNDDGKVDSRLPSPDFTDYALFTEQFALQEGD